MRTKGLMFGRFAKCGARRLAGAIVVGAVCLLAVGCARSLRRVQLVQGEAASIAELWQEPAALEERDLFHGAGGPQFVPRDPSYTFVARDTSGWSPGFDVRSSDGVEWSVKLGPEAQSEVVSSRILWAVGFHQPPMYYVARWNLTGQEQIAQMANFMKNLAIAGGLAMIVAYGPGRYSLDYKLRKPMQP